MPKYLLITTLYWVINHLLTLIYSFIIDKWEDYSFRYLTGSSDKICFLRKTFRQHHWTSCLLLVVKIKVFQELKSESFTSSQLVYWFYFEINDRKRCFTLPVTCRFSSFWSGPWTRSFSQSVTVFSSSLCPEPPAPPAGLRHATAGKQLLRPGWASGVQPVRGSRRRVPAGGGDRAGGIRADFRGGGGGELSGDGGDR